MHRNDLNDLLQFLLLLLLLWAGKHRASTCSQWKLLKSHICDKPWVSGNCLASGLGSKLEAGVGLSQRRMCTWVDWREVPRIQQSLGGRIVRRWYREGVRMLAEANVEGQV